VNVASLTLSLQSGSQQQLTSHLRGARPYPPKRCHALQTAKLIQRWSDDFEDQAAEEALWDVCQERIVSASGFSLQLSERASNLNVPVGTGTRVGTQRSDQGHNNRGSNTDGPRAMAR
jgi:hypothetical protein